jgi:succinate-semialdehyde dehydrogenase/glutarate-semialdehyde dehydrogenase
MVRRGGKRVYGDTIPGHARQAHRRAQAADRRLRGDHAVELPQRHDHAQGGPALAAGCTMVVKPASQTPFSALALAELAERAGMPAGVLSVLTGSAGQIGGEMTAIPLVRKLTFTGSTEIGKHADARSAPTRSRKLSLELGGNAPFIVFDDADLDAAVEGAMISKYRNTGQTCVCANRIYVQAGVYDAFAKNSSVVRAEGRLRRRAGVTQGPLIDDKAVAKVEEHIADARPRARRC